MTDALLDKIAQYGVFAVLFAALLWYVLKQNERRENKLMSIIEKFTPVLESLKNDVCDIKETLGLRRKE